MVHVRPNWSGARKGVCTYEDIHITQSLANREPHPPKRAAGLHTRITTANLRKYTRMVNSFTHAAGKRMLTTIGPGTRPYPHHPLHVDTGESYRVGVIRVEPRRGRRPSRAGYATVFPLVFPMDFQRRFSSSALPPTCVSIRNRGFNDRVLSMVRAITPAIEGSG
jgi:hypothetical protein